MDLRKITIDFVVTISMLSVSHNDVTDAHGWLSQPAGRSSCWRYGYRGCKVNYNDNALNCGGFQVQWEQNSGRCGLCGDPFNAPKPRQNEAGGPFANDVIVARYRSGAVVRAKIVITAPHKGWHEFRICKVDEGRRLTQRCLNGGLLRLAGRRGSRWTDPNKNGSHSIDLQLPAGFTCRHCVLQWKWNTGNRWGCDDTGRCCVGCGAQEQFYACADVQIT